MFFFMRSQIQICYIGEVADSAKLYGSSVLRLSMLRDVMWACTGTYLCVCREGGLRRGVRLPDALHRQDVRLQEAGEEADQEATGRDHGHHGEADPAEDQLALRCQPGLRLRDEGCPLPR